MKRLRINPLVADDLRAIKEYIEEDNSDMAVKVINEIYKQFETVQEFPNIGVDLDKKVSFRSKYKFIVHGNYVILYKVTEEFVEIYRVINRYQDITRIFG